MQVDWIKLNTLHIKTQTYKSGKRTGEDEVLLIELEGCESGKEVE